MGLPKIPSVIYDLQIPGTNEIIQFRPMLMKEYRVLLQAQEMGDEHAFINSIKSVIDACLFNKIDIDNYPMYVIDFIFLKIRAKSVGEIIDAEYQCNAIVNKPENMTESEIADGMPQRYIRASCDCKFKVQINLENSYVKFPEDYHKKCIIQVSDEIGIQLKSPSFKKFNMVGNDKNMVDLTDEFVFACVESVFEGEKVLVPGVDFNIQEFKEFVDSFPTEKIEEMAEFFRHQPKLVLSLELTCPACQTKSVVELNGIKDFFD